MHTGGPGDQNTILTPNLPGIQRSGKKGIAIAECVACGSKVTDFITYDAGPWPTTDRPGRRMTVNLCVKVDRDIRGYVRGEQPYGCAVEYVAFVEKRQADGTVDGLYMHDLIRQFTHKKNPSVVFPDSAEFAKKLPGLPGGPKLF